ncbi:MAG: chromosome segregation SMC family protein [Solirubrobacteraceae bacterium]
MYLKSITLKGFKSFPERTRLEFGPGVSVIVGPNGSGKSNVTDAVLWALGEQSPLAVRGQSMQDVIFGGARGRQANGSAEVELVLDDSEGLLGMGMAEISIFRRLDRTGEGEYRLAGARCRLVDVIEVLSDTGLGKEMHSVISQGRVESIVTSKPRDRRLLIEEAAGLGKHRKRRRRAQLKLTRTQDNLDRELDVEREARSHLRPLKRQAEAAELHVRLERQLLEARWELARDELRHRRQALAQALEEADAVRVRRARHQCELEALAQRREVAEQVLAAASARREELSRRCFAARAAGERVSYRTQAAQGAAATVAARLKRNRERLTALRAQDRGDAPDPAVGVRIDSLQCSIVALDRDREAELARELVQLEQRLADAGAEAMSRAARVQKTRQARDGFEQRVEHIRRVLRDAERAVESARREASRVGGELAAVNQFLRSQAAPADEAVVLAHALEVDPGYELALAAALDGRLGAAVVGDRADAGRVLDRAGADGGRALVACPVAAPPASLAHPRAHGEPPAVGARPLAEHVRGDDQAVLLVRALLRDTWVVTSLDQVPDAFEGVAVTTSGRVWCSGTHELRQAAALGEERVLAQRNRRAQLIAASEAAVGAERSAIVELERVGASVARAERERERAIAEDRAAVRARDDAAEERRRAEALIERRRAAPDDGPDGARRARLQAELAVQRAALERGERERGQRRQRIESVAGAIERDEALRPVVDAVIEALKAAADAISQGRGRFEAALTADREGSEHVAGELRLCAQQEAALQGRLRAENESLTATEVRAQQARDAATRTERELDQLAAGLGLEAQAAEQPLSSEEHTALTSRRERLERRREQLGPVNPLAQDEYAQARERVEDLERQRGDLEHALRELAELIADTDRQIREIFEETFRSAAENFEELSGQLFPGGRGHLRLVNEGERPAAVLGGARPPAPASPSPPGSAAESPAGGGESAEDPGAEDLLGVEIEITPAGKDCKRLSLLSGGEKSMTALAFLFSVFLARPCPFYILDEVEAALDDVNIDRFLELLARYSKRAQFIVVTHQKRTMEAADSLYGVSMGADGVSKVISRRLTGSTEGQAA